MPELPEVEHLRRSLVPLLLGKQFFHVSLNREDTLTRLGVKRNLQLALLKDGVVRALHRCGKNLALEMCDGRVLAVHLGMSGQFLVLSAGEYKDRALTHAHAVWQFGAPSQKTPAHYLVFRDPRRFGGITSAPNMETLMRLRWSKLGPDALSLTHEFLAACLISKVRTLKATLLDQSVIAGLGNIYVDEALFAARLHPTRNPASLESEDVRRLHRAIRTILARAVSAGGSSIRDYLDGKGERGSYATRHQVYGRAGEACRRCGTILESAAVAQRTTVWCPQCQAI